VTQRTRNDFIASIATLSGGVVFAEGLLKIGINLSWPSMNPEVPFSATQTVRDACLCLHAQRAARSLARRFDDALRPLDLTNEQFSLLMSLNQPTPPKVTDLAALLGADRTTLTAALKPLTRRGLVKVGVDERDARARPLGLTPVGHALLGDALKIWTQAHAALEAEVGDAADLRRSLDVLAGRISPSST
jgi:DNA-binding MarR family transcriptional regulator